MILMHKLKQHGIAGPIAANDKAVMNLAFLYEQPFLDPWMTPPTGNSAIPLPSWSLWTGPRR